MSPTDERGTVLRVEGVSVEYAGSGRRGPSATSAWNCGAANSSASRASRAAASQRWPTR
ncbi:hypothetical protein ACFQZC_10010 [Streptacidiphilus monticola]